MIKYINKLKCILGYHNLNILTKRTFPTAKLDSLGNSTTSIDVMECVDCSKLIIKTNV